MLVTKEINELADQDTHCRRLMSAPGVGPIISARWSPRSELAMPSIRAATLRLGLVWHRNKSRPAIEPFSAAYQARQPLSADTVHSGSQSRTAEAPNLGQAWLRSLSRGRSPSGSTRTYWLLRWPRNWRAWPGACSQKAVTTNRASRATPHRTPDRKERKIHDPFGIAEYSAKVCETERTNGETGSTDTSEA